MIADTNTIIREYLKIPATPLFTLVNTRIYCPRLPEGAVLPAVVFFTRGGQSTPYIPYLVEPSVQFDCWAEASATESGSIKAREVYRALYEVLQGIQNVPVVIGANTYYIKSAIEEVQGMDIQDIDYPNYHRVLTFFRIMIQG